MGARRFGLLGHPVGHSVSPAMMRAAFEALGVPHSYDAIDVADRGGLGEQLDLLRAGERAGWNVTVPYKRAVFELADVVGASAGRAGAANVLVREKDGQIRAENTDAGALVRVLDPMLAQRRWALVIGSGGAARAALVACEALGFEGVEVTSRSWTTPEEAWDRGGELPAIRSKVQLGPWVSEWGEPAQLAGREADLVIQATSAGMAGADPGDAVTLRVPWEALPADAVAFDMVYRPRRTPFLDAARGRGLRAVDGLGMLVEQAALALHLWLGVEAPRDVMRRAAEEALGG
ncbi:MAG: shikimate dehydrogenase [Polyangiaceae bacterium]